MTTIQNRKLLLIPSEVKNMASEMKSAIAAYSDEIYDVIAPISLYTQENGLSGQAYSNCKNHMLDHISVVKGMIMANKKFESSLDKLSSIVGTERLDEVELEIIIENCANSIKIYNNRIYDYESKLRDTAYSLYCGDYARRQIHYCNRVIDNLTKSKELAEKKIIKLHKISEESAKCFESISGAYVNIVKGISSLNSGRISKGFKPIRSEQWRTELNAEIAEKDIESIIDQLHKEYPELTEDELSKTKEELIKLYKSKQFARDISTNITSALLENALKAAGVAIGQVATILGEGLIRIGSIPGPVGPNSFTMLDSTGLVGSSLISQGAKLGNCLVIAGRAIPIITAAVDIGIQLHNGESIANASIKGVAHLLISAGTVKAGATIGTAITPGIGTAVGIIAGAVAGTIINVAVDYYYDKNLSNKVNRVVEKISDIGNASLDTCGGIGNAVFG